MGKDLDILQAVKDNDLAGLTKLLQKATKQGKNKLIGSTKRLNINYQDGDGMCALHQAALMSSDQMLLTLLDCGAMPAIRDNKGMVALHYAAWQGHSASVQLLLQRGSPVNEQALEGETPLHLACQHGHFDVVSLLLNQHADPTICNKSLRTSLDMACENGRNRVVELLLRSNLCEKLLEDSPTDTLDNSRTTCLHLAARNGHTDILQTLLQAGMNVNRSTLKGTALHEAATAGKMDAVKLLLDWGIDVNRPNSYDQTALDIVTKSASGSGTGGKDLKRVLKEASCAVYARALRDYSNIYDPGSLAFKEGDIITVLEQRTDGIWRGYVVQEGRMAKAGMFPANHVALVDTKVYRQSAQCGHMYSQVPDLLPRGAPYSSSGNISSSGGTHTILPTGSTATHTGSDRGSLGSSGTDDSSSYSSSSLHTQQQQQQHYPSSLPYPPPPSSLLSSATGGGFMPPRSPLSRDPSGADSGFSSSQSLPQYTPSSPAGPAQLGKSPFAFGPTPGSTVTTNGPSTPNGFLAGNADNNGHASPYPGNPPAFQYGPGPEWLAHHHHHHQNHLAGVEGGGNNMRGGASPARDSPAHSNRNSAASSDSGRGYSTGGGHVMDSKLSHNYVNMHMSNNNINNSGGNHPHHYHAGLQHQKLVVGSTAGSLGGPQQQQHRLSGQSYESGVSSRQSYHSSGSSSVGSLDMLEEQGGTYSSSATINVGQLVQAGVADTEVLHAWLNDLEFGEYYPLFLQAGYDMPTIFRMTPEDLTAIGITKPAHRKRLKSEIARLNIHDGIPEFRPSDLMEWLHLLGLGAYLDTLCGQGYDSLDYVTDITWEDLEEIGIKKLGHQKKIMLAIDRLKRLKSSGKRISAMDGRTASLELLEPPPPAPPISGRWSGGEGMGIPPHVYDVSGGMVGGARPKKSPSGDSISTTSSGNSGSGSSGAGSGPHPYHGGEMRVIPLPREDAGGGPGMAGGIPFRHNSTGSASGLQPDVVAIQVKRNLRGSISEDKRGPGNSPGGNYFQQHQYSTQQQQQQQLMYHSFQGPVRRTSESDVFADHHQIRSFEAEDRRRPSIPAEFESEKHEAELNTDGHKHLFLAPKANKAGVGNGLNQSSLKVETGEHIYDTPQISPSQKSPRPAVMPKPSVSFAPNPVLAGPLHVNTGPEVSQTQSKPSPVGKGGKKVPPPPPIRTDSIRGDSVPPGSPSRCLSSGQAPASTVSVSASIHPPHTSSISTSVSGPPKVAAKPTPPPVMQKPQLQQPHITAKIQQEPTQQQFSSQAHSTVTTGPLLASIGSAKSGPLHSRPEPSILIKPKVSTGPPSPYGQQAVKSPLPAKASIGTASAPAAPNQNHLSHLQGKNPSVPSPAYTVSGNKSSDAHSQALSSCMKSLSEKIAGKAQQKEEKEKDDEDQFPDNVSTDSDDFPPPPPPIAMDIITPKIHNYGIPSSRKPGEFGLHHRHDFSHKPQPGLMGSPRMMGPPGMSPRIGTGVSYAEVHHRPDAATSRTAPLQTSSMSAAYRVQPSGHMSSPQVLSTKLSSAQTIGTASMSSSAAPTGSPSRGVVASNQIPNNSFNTRPPLQQKENLPADSAYPMSTDNRSDSTSSFESTSSSSSMDSNTLPFANENVGTIKQRAAAITTTVSDTTTTTTTSTTTTNCALPSVSVIGQALASRSQESESHRNFPPSSSSSSPHHQRQPSGGGVRPPVPSKKPTLSPKPARLQPDKSLVTASSSVAATAVSTTAAATNNKTAQNQLWPEQQESAHKHSSNVLSDIDDMLQGLTDELDAALEEELAS